MSDFDNKVRAKAVHVYNSIGEKHAFTALSSSLAWVIRDKITVEYNGGDVANLFHDPLASIADYWDKEQFTSEKVVQNMDNRFMYATGFPYPLQQVDEGRGLSYPRQPDINLNWIVNDWNNYLKTNKIRKGSKKHKEEISLQANRVFKAAVKTVDAALAKNDIEIDKQKKDVSDLMDMAGVWLERFEHKVEIRNALLEAADLVSNQATDREIDDMSKRYEHLVQRLKAHLVALDEAQREDADDLATVSMEANVDLKPFLEHVRL